MKQKTFLIADTETLGLAPNNFVFDFAYIIATRTKELIRRSFLIREILCDPGFIMRGFNNTEWRKLFGVKIFTEYMPALDESRMKIFNWRDVVETLREDMRTFNVKVFSAYNINFDMRALGKTQHAICNGGKILEYKPDLLDLWLFSCVTALNTQLYHDTARQQGWITPADNVRTTAEKTYAFLSGNFDFIEKHIALDDAIIETEILQILLAKKKIIPYNQVQCMPWQQAQKIRGTLL